MDTKLSRQRINSCEKGKREERAARDAWRRAGLDARRGQQRAGSPDSPDIITCVKSIHVEVKGCQNTDIYGWLEQARRDSAGSQRLPIVQHRKKRKPWVVILTFDNFIALLKETNRAPRNITWNEHFTGRTEPNESIIRSQQGQGPADQNRQAGQNEKATNNDTEGAEAIPST